MVEGHWSMVWWLTPGRQVIIIAAALARIAPSTEGRTVAVFFFGLRYSRRT
jgi:hypothetical protein